MPFEGLTRFGDDRIVVDGREVEAAPETRRASAVTCPALPKS